MTQASGVATPFRKRLLGPILALLGACSLLGGGYYFGQKAGFNAGVDFYHHVCYDIAPAAIVAEDGTAVVCGPLTQVPKEELDKMNKDRV